MMKGMIRGALSRRAWCILLRGDQAPQVSRSMSQLAGVSRSDRAGILSSLRQERREFASEVGKDQPPPPPRKVNVPKHVPGVHGKYASAFYISCYNAGILDRVESEIQELAKAVKESPELQNFVSNIFIEKADRVKVIHDVLEKSNLHQYTKNFFAILASDGALRHFPKIASSFSDIMAAHRGHVKAVITSADELSDNELETVKTKLISQMIDPGQVAFIEQKIDEDILGGVIIHVGDKMLDMSISKRIQQIEKILMQAV